MSINRRAACGSGPEAVRAMLDSGYTAGLTGTSVLCPDPNMQIIFLNRRLGSGDTDSVAVPITSYREALQIQTAPVAVTLPEKQALPERILALQQEQITPSPIGSSSIDPSVVPTSNGVGFMLLALLTLWALSRR